jgi:hypothetical protein
MQKKGFTLLEILLVISIVMVLGTVSLNSVLGLFLSADIKATAGVLESSLKRAQQMSKDKEQGSVWGVKVLDGSIVIFAGDNYLSRDTTKDVSTNTAQSIFWDNTQVSEVSFDENGMPKGIGDSVYFLLNARGNLRRIVSVYGSAKIEVRNLKTTDTVSFGWHNANFGYRKKLTIDNTLVAGSSNLVDFPALISYTDTSLKLEANGGKVANPNGYDIIFTDGNHAIRWDYEIEKYDSNTGEVVAWVRIPELSTTQDTDLYVYYGSEATVVSLENKNEVWDANFKGVWHLGESQTGMNNSYVYKDSTSNANDGNDFVSSVSVAGKVGNALDLATSEYVSMRDNDVLDIGENEDFTLSSWVKSSQASAVDKYPSPIRKQGEGETLVEDFETGDFSANNWTFGGNAPWSIASSEKYEGSYSARSGVIGDYQTTSMQMSITSQEDFALIFATKVSTEGGGADSLDIYVDGVKRLILSGEESWGQNLLFIPAGTHTVKWEYAKDYGVSEGSDAVWVDDIRSFSLSSGGDGYGISLHNSNVNNEWRAEYYDGSTLNSGLGTSNLANGSWWNIVMQRSGSNLILYENGSVVRTVASQSTGDIGSSLEFLLGSSNSTYNYIGQIDEVQFSKSARSADWIATTYNNQNLQGTGSGKFVKTLGAEENYVDETQEGDWYSNSYRYRKNITINGDKIAGEAALTNMPVLVSIQDVDLRHTGSGGYVKNSSGYDIVFVSKDNTVKYDHEIESYDPATGEINMWVRVPTLNPGQDFDLWVYYGNPAIVASQENKSGVWQQNYKAVYHLTEDVSGTGTAGTYKDSTSSSNNGGDYVSDTNKGGLVYLGQKFDGSDDYINIPSSASLDLVNQSDFTILGCLKPLQNTSNPQDRTLVSSMTGSGTASDILGIDNTGSCGGGANQMISKLGGTEICSGYTLKDDHWQMLTITGTEQGGTDNLKMYYNGDEVKSQNVNFVTNNSAVWNLGIDKSRTANSSIKGQMDEIRISNVARTAGWVKTEYNMITSGGIGSNSVVKQLGNLENNSNFIY